MKSGIVDFYAPGVTGDVNYSKPGIEIEDGRALVFFEGDFTTIIGAKFRPVRTVTDVVLEYDRKIEFLLAERRKELDAIAAHDDVIRQLKIYHEKNPS